MKVGRFQIALLIFGQVLVPSMLLLRLVQREQPSYIFWLLNSVGTGSLCLFLFYVGRWDWLGYNLRYVLLACLLLAVGFAGLQPMPLWTPLVEFSDYSALLVEVLLATVFVYLLASVVRHRPFGVDALNLEFPLAAGRFYIAHGGSTSLLNYHAVHQAQRYALDVVQLNRLGKRASGLYPRDLAKYAIFGTRILAPCTGRIVRVVDGLSDHVPPALDAVNRAGNHVVIEVGERTGYFIVLAHFQKDSISVTENQFVQDGEMLGRVGNSGNTTEPHLHLHACTECDGVDYLASGRGIPITFGRRFLVRNDIVRSA